MSLLFLASLVREGDRFTVEGVLKTLTNYNGINSRIAHTVILSRLMLERDISAALRRI